MIPRSVPETANRDSVLFGLFGPVTQPTSDVPGGSADGGAGAGAGAASGTGWAAAGCCWLAAAGGVGAGATSACLCTVPDCGVNALSRARDIWPSLGRGALAFALGGRCPLGSPPVVGNG